MTYSVKDLQKALNYLDDKYKSLTVNIEINDLGQITFSITDISANSVKIIVYKNSEEGTKMPEILEMRRLL